MSSMSPEKQQELADRILERAELAQMARKLKLGLSKVASPKKNGGGSALPLGAKNKNRYSSEPDSLSIPTSAGRSRARFVSITKPSHVSESPTRRSTMKSPSRTVSSSGTGTGTGNSNAMMATTASRRTSIGRESHMPAIPSTPKAKSGHQSVSDPKGASEEGADLLMYLATSPYASSSAGNLGAGRRPSFGHSSIHHGIPTTPSSNMYAPPATAGSESHLNDITRLSHIKDRASSSSPQSTFKQPVMIPSSTMHELMQSPSVAMFTSPRRKLAADDQQLLVPGTPSRIGLSAASMTSDQLNDSQSKIGSLLKTPNFNMGDYVHTLFSPSPRIDTTHQSRD